MSLIIIPAPTYNDDLNSNLERLKILLSELDILRGLFENRLNLKINILLKDDEELEKIGIPKPVFKMDHFVGKYTGIELNLFFKSYLMVFRQTQSILLKIIFQAKKLLGYENVNNAICNGALDGGFTNFIKGINEDRFNYDQEILDVLKKHLDLFITCRIIRNSLKVQATFSIMVFNNEDIDIICPLTDKDKNCSTIELLSNLSIPKEKIDRITLKPYFVKTSLEDIKEISDLVIKKIEQKNTSANNE